MYKLTEKKRNVLYKELSCDDDQRNKKVFLQWIITRKCQNKSYTSSNLNHSSTFILEKKSLLSATSVLCQQPKPMAYNTTASLDKLLCTDYVDFSKCQEVLGQFSWFSSDSNSLDVNVKVVKKCDNKDFCRVQNLTAGEIDFKQFLRLWNQLVVASERFKKEENLSLVQIPTISKDMDEELKLAHKVVDVLDRANGKICVTLLR